MRPHYLLGFVILATGLLLASWQGCTNDDGPSNAELCSGIDCSGHGICAVTSMGDPMCGCDVGYYADALSCVPEGTTGPCLEVDCSGHGTCVDTEGAASCLCDDGYHAEGLQCVGAEDCEGIDCSGHGTCEVLEGEATCNCDEGYHFVGTSCLPDSTTSIVTLEALYDIMHQPSDLHPLVCHPNIANNTGPHLQGSLDEITAEREASGQSWNQMTPWCEIEEAADTCTCTNNRLPDRSSNTAVEKSRNYLLIRVGGTWSLVRTSEKSWPGAFNPSKTTTKLGCGVEWRAPLTTYHADGSVASNGSNFHTISGDGYDMFVPGRLPDGRDNVGAWQHPFGGGRYDIQVPANTIEECCMITFVRLTQIDPNGVDDRNDANYVMKCGTDLYSAEDGTIPPMGGAGYRGGTNTGRYIRASAEWQLVAQCSMPVAQAKANFVAENAGLANILPSPPSN